MTGNDEHDLGLSHDLGRLLSRRRAMALFASASAVGAAGCDGLPFFSRAEAEIAAVGPDGRKCVVHPAEIAGPFPADGSNRAHGTLVNALRDAGIVRRDMRTNLDGTGAPAEGVPLRLTVSLVDVTGSCAPLKDHAVYLWHCDAVGKYSIYDLPAASYLRSVGVTDAGGNTEFLTIVPGCYPGRFPHMHFEVYPSLVAATDYHNRILTSQLAIPASVCNAVYREAPAYSLSAEHFKRSPLERDMIFADNTPGQLAAQTLKLEPDSDKGYTGTVTIGVKAR